MQFQIYWNIIRQLRQNNVEDLYALKRMTKSDYSVKVKSKFYVTVLPTIILKPFITNIRKAIVQLHRK